MYSPNRTIRTINLIGAFVLAAATARAVDPPPDGGYPNFNTAEGDSALFSLTTGSNNTAIGSNALLGNTTGGGNTAIGNYALFSNTTGGANTAIGVSTLYFNTTGGQNTATGFSALAFNTTGDYNTATGGIALVSNTTGIFNTATGIAALQTNTTGSNNTATGSDALDLNATGSNNTADGVSALFNNTNGSGNIALGYNAGYNLTTGSNNIDIGNVGKAGEAKTIRIGTKRDHKSTFIAGISGATVAAGVGIIIDTNGRLGTVVSSARFKDEIKPMDDASNAILALKPVTFRYKKELDPEGIPQFGLVAEQVEKVNPDLVARDEEGKPYTVRYEAVNAMLLNEFLKEHRSVQELKTTVAEQQAQIQALTAALKAQAAQIQKVSDQVRAQAPAPRVVANN
jgi:Chaperone of endosialidase